MRAVSESALLRQAGARACLVEHGTASTMDIPSIPTSLPPGNMPLSPSSPDRPRGGSAGSTASRSPRRSRPQSQNQAPELATVVGDDLRPSTSAGTGVDDGEASEQTSAVRVGCDQFQRIVAEAAEAQCGMMPIWSWGPACARHARTDGERVGVGERRVRTSLR